MMMSSKQLPMRSIKISFVMLLSIMILISNLPGFAKANIYVLGTIYYVATWGSDQNDGSEDAPWQSIQHAANMAKPGDTVLVHGGIYKENITIRNSGSSSRGFITIQAFPGETPVISGKDSRGSTLVQFYNAHYIIFDGFELRDLQSTDASKYLSGIKVIEASSNIIIQNNHLHSIAHTGSKGNANGIIVYGNSQTAIENIKVANNYLHDLVLGSSEALTIVGNVDGFLVEGNVIERVNNIGIDIAGFFGTCSGDCIDQARNGSVIGNKVSYIDTIDNPVYRGYRAAAAIYVDGGTNTIIERNEVSYSNYGFEIASEKYGKAATKIVLRNNYIHHNHMSGLIMGGSSTSNGGAKENYILNNTFYSNNELRTGDGEITFQNNVKENVFANNIFVTATETPYFYDNATSNSGNTIDYNLYYGLGQDVSYWRLNGKRYESVEQFQKATGQDQHSIVADPNFNSGDSEIALGFGSPAIDTGTMSYKIFGELDYHASARVVGSSIDIGATEFISIEQQPTIEPTSEPTSTITPTNAPTSEPTSTIAPTTKPSPAPDDSPFVIDGIDQEWGNYPNLATNSDNAKVLKAIIDKNTLYVLINGQLLKEKGQLYIRIGQASNSYFEVPYWSNQEANYLIENGILYQYSGSGKDWSWNKVKDYRNEAIVINNSTIEMAIPLIDFNSHVLHELHVGYIWKDSKSNQLPAGGAMVKVTAKTQNEQPQPSTAPSITIDGKLQDWSSYPAISAKSDQSLAAYVTNDAEYLYIAVQSKISFKKTQIYLNTDQKISTGYQSSKWEKSGVDYLIENGVLYRYTGDNKSWSFQKQLTFDQSSYTSTSRLVEMRVPLSSIGLKTGQRITVGVMLDDKPSLKLPQAGAFVQYDLK